MIKKISIKNLFHLMKLNKDISVKVDTPYGFKKILKCEITAQNSKRIKTTTENKMSIITSPMHLLKKDNGEFKKVIELLPGDILETKNGGSKILKIEILKEKNDLYDIEVQDVHQYYSNGIVSHNSSLIDTICFSLFGTWTKDFVKNINFIHDLKNTGETKVVLDINGKEYSIFRKLEKVKKGKKIDCSNTIEFICITDNQILNGDKIGDTQKKICEMIGTIDDFLFTSISAQYHNFSLIEEKNTKRKQFFSRILGIDIYEKIFDIAKNDLNNLEIQISKFNIQQNSELDNYEDILMENNVKINNLNQKINDNKSLLQATELLFKEKKREDILFTKKVQEFIFLESELKKIIEKRQKIEKELKEFEEIDIIFDKNELLNLKKEQNDVFYELKTLNSLRKEKFRQKVETEEAENLLNSVPCQNKFPECIFLIKANQKIDKIDNILQDLLNIEQNIIIFEEKSEQIKKNIIKLEELEQKSILQEKKQKQKQLKLLELESLSTIDLENRINSIQIDHNANRQLLEKIHSLEFSISKLKEEIYIDEFQLSLLEKKNKSLQTLKEELEQKNKEKTKLIQQFDLLNEYCFLVGKNGIIMNILYNIMPAISDMMNSIISNIAKFTVEIEIEDDKNLEIYIQDDISKRLIETASGSQKTIIAYALRLALINYSQLCSSNLFILDEPATSLDQTHLNQFAGLLDMIKSLDKTILLVTHIDILKECVDHKLMIEKINGFSNIIG